MKRLWMKMIKLQMKKHYQKRGNLRKKKGTS